MKVGNLNTSIHTTDIPYIIIIVTTNIDDFNANLRFDCKLDLITKSNKTQQGTEIILIFTYLFLIKAEYDLLYAGISNVACSVRTSGEDRIHDTDFWLRSLQWLCLH
jgi:hypothetical protein